MKNIKTLSALLALASLLSASEPELFLRDSTTNCTVTIHRAMTGSVGVPYDRILITVYKNGAIAYRYTIRAEADACNLDIVEQYPVTRHVPAHDETKWIDK